jgi:2-oxoglutarate ferredoxin oxidoreductase subunit alpha
MMEGLSYIAGSEVPVVLIDVMRGGPGLGNISPSQGDYSQMVKGGGHGDYKMIVLAPATVQECVDLTYEAFELAEKYRSIVVILADGSLGQMMEPAELPDMLPLRAVEDRPEWSLVGSKDRAPNIITSIYMDPVVEEEFNLKLQEKYRQIEKDEVRYSEQEMEDAEIAIVAFGTAGRITQSAIKRAREEGIRVGLHRPISLYPFPSGRLKNISEQVRSILVVEMNSGQMIEDVRLAVEGRIPVEFYGRMGGVVPLPEEILDEIYKLHSTY